jgi:LysM repeat protein
MRRVLLTALCLSLFLGAAPVAAQKPRTHRVRSGDSIAKVADYYGVSQDDLRAQNGLSPGQNLKVGDEIRIPARTRGGGRAHVVKPGDTLAAVAKTYSVPVARLAAANKLGKQSSLQPGRTLVIPLADEDADAAGRPKKIDTLVKSGEVVRGGVRHAVQPGQNLWIIARAYNVTKERIIAANNMGQERPLTAGEKILIPGARQVVPVRVRGYTIQPIHFVRISNGKRATLRLMKANGQINPASRRELSRLSSPTGTKKNLRLLHPRLLHMIQRVAERWPGQQLELVSGYRPSQTGTESYHTLGQALDFRVSGVPNRELYEFCTQLPDTGCGYYPNSVFIHMDVRDRSAVWTDWSGPGEKAMYTPPATEPAQAAEPVP